MMPSELPETWQERIVKPTAPAATVPTTSKPSTTGASRYGAAAIADELAKVRATGVGGRNDQVFRSAIALAQLFAGGEGPDCRDDLIATVIAPDFTESEARKAVTSGWTRGLAEPRTAPPKPGRPESTTGKPAAVVDIASAETWPDPEPLPDGLPVVPAFDEHLLPESLRAWAIDIGERLQCPGEYPSAAALVAMGAVVGRKCAVRPKQKDNWTVLPNVWGGIVAPPAAAKSPAIKAAFAPLQRLIAEAAAIYARESQNREARQALREAKQNGIRKRMAMAIKDGQDTALLVDEFTEATSEEEVQERRYVVNDGTTEKIGELLIANQNGLLAFRDELSGWFATLDRDGHENDRAFYLESWDGDHGYTVDRIGRGTQHIPALCLSVFGGIQPGRLAPYLSSALRGGQGDDGLMQRFQVLVFPDPPRTWVNIDRWPDGTARNRAFEVFQHLDRLTPSLVGATLEDGELPFLRFDGASQELFNGWLADLMNRLRAGEEHPAVESHLSKFRKLMPALALLFHLADGGQGAITLASTQRAAAWCDFLEAHARRIYASVVAERLRAAKALLGKLRSGKLASPFGARDVYRASWAGLDDREVVGEALATLADHGWVRSVTRGTASRPATEYLVHPSVLARSADLSVLSVPQTRDTQEIDPSRARSQRIADDA
jgi:putative DNA primase/helicase